MDKFFTWEFLGSFAGIILFLTLLIQFTKIPLDNLVFKLFGKSLRLKTRFVLWVVTVILLCITGYFVGGLTADKIAIIPFNAVLVTWTAMGAYESASTIKKIEALSTQGYGKKPPG
jgi:hypothetical protein